MYFHPKNNKININKKQKQYWNNNNEKIADASAFRLTQQLILNWIY